MDLPPLDVPSGHNPRGLYRLRTTRCEAGTAARGHRSSLETGVALDTTSLMPSDALLPIYKLYMGFGSVHFRRELWQQHRMPWQVCGQCLVQRRLTHSVARVLGFTMEGERQDDNNPGHSHHSASGRGNYGYNVGGGMVTISYSHVAIRVIRAHRITSGLVLSTVTS